MRLPLICTSALLVCSSSAQMLLDPAFTTNGYTQDNMLYGPHSGIAVYNDGRIVGTLDQYWLNDPSTQHSHVTRYLPNGTVDQTFGTNGTASAWAHGEDSHHTDIAIQNDDRVIYIGFSEYCVELICGLPNLLIGCLRSDGVVDSTFGENGLVTSEPIFGNLVMGAYGRRVYTLPDGRILAAGEVSMDQEYQKGWVLRLLPDGTLDTSFGPNGTGVVYTAQWRFLTDMQIMPDGSISIVGYVNNGMEMPGYVSRFTSEGIPITGFGDQGTVEFNLGDRTKPATVVGTATGNILVGGSVRNCPNAPDTAVYFAFVKEFTSMGDPGPNIPQSEVLLELPNGTGALEKLIPLADGRMLVTGGTNVVYVYDGFVGRLMADGTPDISFTGTNDDYVTYPLGVGGTRLWDMVLLDANNILVSGCRYPQLGMYQSALLMKLNSSGNVGVTTGLTEIAERPALITASPNPTEDHVRITGFVPRVPVVVNDALGRMLMTERGSAQMDLDLSGLAPGVYTVAQSGKAVQVVKR